MGFGDILKEALTVLAQNSPFAFVVVVVVLFAFYMHKSSIKHIKESYNTSIKEIQNSNDKANEQIRANMKLLTEFYGKPPQNYSQNTDNHINT